MLKKNNKIYLNLFCIVFISLFLIVNISAAFTKDHLYWSLKALSETNSPITQQCVGKWNLILDGNTGADVPVLHYFDEEFFSYISTHTKGIGYDECLREAGSDSDLQCNCYGVALHNIQDHFFHTEGGVVPKYLKKTFLPNLMGHMMVEQSFLNQHQKLLEENKDILITNGQLDFYDNIVLDSYFEQTGGDEKYVKQLDAMTGLDTRTDLNIFANGYKGQGFFDTVYNQKVKLPFWFYGLSYGMLILGFGLTILLFILAWKMGHKGWVILLIIPWLLLGIIGSVILIAFYTNNTWQVITAVISIPNNLGLLTISNVDIENYDKIVIAQSKRFLETGVLPYDDNSGLTYEDREGNHVEGALIKAESGFKFIILPILIFLFIVWELFFGYKTFISRRNKKKKK